VPTIAELLGSNEPSDRLRPGLAFWLKGNPPFESDKEHCFFMLAVNSDGYYLMVNATSRVEKTQAVVKARFSEFVQDTSSTLVVVEKGDFPLLSKRSVINCNELHAVKKTDVDRADTRFIDHSPHDELFRTLAHAVKNSPNVSENDKLTICEEWGL